MFLVTFLSARLQLAALLSFYKFLLNPDEPVEVKMVAS